MKIGIDVFVKKGISENQINQLIEYTHTDPSVIKFTSDPIRFKDRNSFEVWLQKGRKIYTLVDGNENLLGIFWYGPKIMPNHPEYNYCTFSIRLYSRARDQGLSYPFLKFAFDDLLIKEGDKITGFWLETSVDNFAAIKTYEKFGFRSIDHNSTKTKVLMIKEIRSI
jgi:RimJ/RimL family protein N-acetyltransferase